MSAGGLQLQNGLVLVLSECLLVTIVEGGESPLTVSSAHSMLRISRPCIEALE